MRLAIPKLLFVSSTRPPDDSYRRIVKQKEFKKIDRAKPPTKKIQNPNIEIRNKLTNKSQVRKIQNTESE